MSKDDDATVSNSFVGRWSKRKLQVKTENSSRTNVAQLDDELLPITDVLPDVADEPGQQPVATLEDGDASSHANDDSSIDAQVGDAEQAHESSSEEDEEPLLTDAQMPDISTLDAKSDVSPFFNRGVSESLRKQALRHIFSLPIHNIRDGLNDYDEDYTVWEPLGDSITCDMKFHERRKEKERLEQERLAAEEAEAARQYEDENTEQDAPLAADESDTENNDELAAEDETTTTESKDTSGSEESNEEPDIDAVEPQPNLLANNDVTDTPSIDKNATEPA